MALSTTVVGHYGAEHQIVFIASDADWERVWAWLRNEPPGVASPRGPRAGDQVPPTREQGKAPGVVGCPFEPGGAA